MAIAWRGRLVDFGIDYSGGDARLFDGGRDDIFVFAPEKVDQAY